MVSRSPPPSKRGRRKDDDDKSCRQEKLEKGKEPAAKDADEEPLFDSIKFVVELLKSAFSKLQGVGEAFDIKAHHDVYKDLSVKGLAFWIHGLDDKLDGDNGDDCSHGSDDGDDGSHGGDDFGTPTN
jgi:hypothetical protein